MAIRLVIADVDGTLVNQKKELTEGTRAAVARLRAGGVRFTVTSGRPPKGLRSLVGPLALTAPIAAFNGGMYVMPDLTTVVNQRTLSLAAAKEAVAFLQRAGLEVWVYRGWDWFIGDPLGTRVERERHNVGFDPISIDDPVRVLDGAIKIVGVDLDFAKVAQCEASLSALLGSEASVARSQPYYLDVTHPEANKGMVVRDSARFLKIPVEDVATVGDQLNDVPMLKIAGMGIAMGNSPPEVQRHARHVTRSNEEDGFAHAVDSFILGEPPMAGTKLGLPPRTRACLFGLEGVLTQSAELHARAWKKLLDFYLKRRAETSGVPFIPFDALHDYARYFDGRSPLEGLREFLAARSIELREMTVMSLVERRAEVLAEVLAAERVEAYESSIRYVKQARAAGLRTAVISSSARARDALRSAGIDGLFDAVIEARAQPGIGTAPASDDYLLAVEAMGLQPEEIAVFELLPARHFVSFSQIGLGFFMYSLALFRKSIAVSK